MSLFSHVPLDNIPPCNVIRFSIEYTITLVKENPPENFVIQELDMFSDFIFTEILELYDFDYDDKSGGCRRFHFMPRFARLLPNNGKEILSMHQVMTYLLTIRKPVITEDKLASILKLDTIKSRFLDFMHDMIVTCPGKKPSSVRCDQVDRDQAVSNKKSKQFPLIIHEGVMPTQLTYAADPKYKKLFKSFLRMRHLLLNRSRASHDEQQSYINIQNELAKIRKESYSPKEVNSEIPCNEVLITGIRSDVCQHALIMPVLVNYLRYYLCLDKLNVKLGNIFTDKVLLKRAMTHPSYRLTFGMNSDHIRNSLYNCGIRQPEFGEKNWQSNDNRKKGIVNLVKIMSRLAEEEEVSSNIHHYERLEFLGDAVVEFITSTTLYHLFPDVEEGGLAVYRQALVENQHLAKLAKKLQLEHYMLYSHGPDLCRDQDLRHAVANCLEAVMGAIYLEKGIEEARRVFCTVLFEEEDLRQIWARYPKHPLQVQLPDGDRHMIKDFPVLQRMTEFEECTGMKFKHIRLLARAFTQRTIGYNELTLTQSIICQDLGLEEYMLDDTACRFARKGVPMKLQADLLEALLGAMYVDSGLDVVEAFCNVCFFPRLREFIIEQDWNDDKSKLQQVVLTLRKEGAEQPDIPQYKLLKKSGPTNASVYTVAVFFKGKRIGVGSAERYERVKCLAGPLNSLAGPPCFAFLEACKQAVPVQFKLVKAIQSSLTATDIS
ncbi:putative ribonuclease 3-like [Apostichopus japonicus]|uniref:Putative ribonuclease 3-like n=1 Tax=Stichopus japonicus TaxID=307972 RepID=A0A2G8JJC2_STIJA|nr:putative ribonuclease 3-like [Apostichopus japonicus]